MSVPEQPELPLSSGSGDRSAPAPPAANGPGASWWAAGPVRVEAFLVERVSRCLDAALESGELWRRPVRVVVPSESLRLHVSGLLVRRLGTRVGVSVSTVQAVALEILARCDVADPPGEAALALALRRACESEPALRRALGQLRAGYETAAASLRDLLDAGFEGAQADALLEALAEAPGSGAARERAAALVRAAARALAGGEAGRAGRLRRALACLREDPERALPAAALFLHGFADATGRVADLLLLLHERLGAEILFDAPPAAGRGGGPDPTLRFGQRLRERFRPPAPAPGGEGAAAPGRLAGLAAPDPGSELRAVGREILGLLDAGSAPERIGVVMRDPTAWVLPLRRHFDRLGIPYSGLGIVGPGGGLQRRARALGTLLAEGAAAPLDAWLDARWQEDRSHTEALRLALRRRGWARLRDLGERDERGDLPAVPGRATGPEGDPDAEARHFPGSLASSGRSLASARRLLRRLRRWPERGRVADQLERLADLVREDLRWPDDAPDTQELLARVDEALGALDSHEELSLSELRALLQPGLEALGASDLGGLGGGVACLTVMEARGRTFDHLFAVGLSRDVFPRRVSEDPLLPDSLRQALRVVLPDLPVKKEGVDEERFLFSQLVAASPDVLVSWPQSDGEGRPLPASTFVDGLRWSHPDFPVHTPPAGQAGAPEAPIADAGPAFEWALRARLHGDRELWRVATEAAWREARADGADPGELDPERTAKARWAALACLSRPFWDPGPLGPHFGLVSRAGSVGAEEDGVARGEPRRFFVTRLEAVARCGWKAFLERELRLEPVPDPLQALPSLGPVHVGRTAHAALERWARQVPLAEDLEAAAGMPGTAAPWPGEAELEAWLLAAAEGVLAEDGVHVPGLAAALARLARPHLERVRVLDGAAPPCLVGAEIQGELRRTAPGGEEVRLAFRADRAERRGGALVLVDYKTGAPLSAGIQADTRKRHLEARLRAGTVLQVAAYADHPAVHAGELLYTRPEIQDDHARVRVQGDDLTALEAFQASTPVLIGALLEGAAPPRLLSEPRAERTKDGPECQNCPVKEACLHGDTGARQRVQRWLARDGSSDSPLESLARSLWRLYSPKLAEATR